MFILTKSPTAKSPSKLVPDPVTVVVAFVNVTVPVCTVEAGASLNSKVYSITSDLFSDELTLSPFSVTCNSDQVPLSKPTSSTWFTAFA